MKVLTLVIRFEDGAEFDGSAKLGQDFIGGRLTAMAAYDCVAALEVAEDAVNCCTSLTCESATEQIKKIELAGYSS